jgi:hypothetical protein
MKEEQFQLALIFDDHVQDGEPVLSTHHEAYLQALSVFKSPPEGLTVILIYGTERVIMVNRKGHQVAIEV